MGLFDNRCPICGERSAKSLKYCPSCGHTFRSTKQNELKIQEDASTVLLGGAVQPKCMNGSKIRRHALFVGVNTYDDTSIRRLRYSIPDASVLADRFKGFGYTTRLLADPTGAELKAAVMESVEGLGSGDVFLFFFAGHGFTSQDGAHLLFCRDDMQRLLRVNAAGTRVDAIEALTADGGFHRAFLLDSCRTDCFAAVECRGGGTTRDLDLVSMPECTNESGSFYLLRSCDKFRPALEFDAIGHGLFTQGLLDAMDARDCRLAYCDTSFATAIGGKMEGLQRVHHVTNLQRPSIGEVSGPAFSLFDCDFLNKSQTAASVKHGDGLTIGNKIRKGTEGISDLEKGGLVRDSESTPECLKMITKLIPGVQLFPHVKMGKGFTPYVVGSDTGCILIWPIGEVTDFEDAALNLEETKAALSKDEPCSEQVMAFILHSQRPVEKAIYEKRNIHCLTEKELVACALDFFSETKERIRLGKAAYYQENYKAAIDLLENSDADSDAEAQYILGCMYDKGEGIGQDRKAAEALYWKSANKGYEPAIAALQLKYDDEKRELRDAEDKIVAEIEEFTKHLLEDAEDKESADKDVTVNIARAQTVPNVIDGSFSDNVEVSQGGTLTVRGTMSGNVRIRRAGKFVCGSSCTGNVEVERDGTFVCEGNMSANIVNHGGTAQVMGACTGNVMIDSGGRFECRGTMTGQIIRT